MKNEQNTGFLPLGSVVLLTDGKKRLLIIGREQISSETKRRFDYSGVLFPEGYQKADELYLFNNSDVEQIFQMGLIDNEELAFQNLLNQQNNNNDLSNTNAVIADASQARSWTNVKYSDTTLNSF